MKVLNEYPGSHHYLESYEKTKYHCPNCAMLEVWKSGSGDYYLGETFICTGCSHFFYLPHSPMEIVEANVLGILEQLKSGVTQKPTTPKGN